MKDKLRKLAEDYTVNTESGQELYDELCVLFSVVGQSEQLADKNFDCFEYSQGFHRCFKQCKNCKNFS